MSEKITDLRGPSSDEREPHFNIDSVRLKDGSPLRDVFVSDDIIVQHNGVGEAAKDRLSRIVTYNADVLAECQGATKQEALAILLAAEELMFANS